MHHMTIYTRGGDAGWTGLADGARIPKSDERVEIYGLCDELNSFIGCAASLLEEDRQAELKKDLLPLQNQLL